MSEYFETFRENGEPNGLVERSEVHELGLWHRASNVFLFRTDGKLVVQRRQDSKDVCPGAWDLSVAEHLLPGESFEDGAIRGLREELGISGVMLEPASPEIKSKFEVSKLGIKDYEVQVCFRGVSDAELVLQASEVAEIRLFNLEDLKSAMLRTPDRFTKWFRERASDIGLFG